MSFKNFLIWNLISFYQGNAIFIAGFYCFNNFLSNFVEITFTALILAETFNIIFLVPRCSKWLFMSIGITFGLYVACVFVFPSSFPIHLFHYEFFMNVGKVFFITWVPVFIVTKLYKLCYRDFTDLVWIK